MQQNASTASIVCAILSTNNECENNRNKSNTVTKVLAEKTISNFSPTACGISK